MPESPKAFVILPFEPQFNKVYSEVIKPICEELGYEVNKADSINSHQNILQDIVKGIYEADLLIADLTTSNTNVFYELGIAHGLGIPTVLITQDIDEVPFDLTAYKVIEYSTDFTEIDELREELKETGEKHLEGEIQFGSPVTDFTDIDIVETSSESNDSEDETEAELGVLDYASEAESRRLELESDLAEIENSTLELQTELVRITGEVNSLEQEQGSISPKRANKLAKEAASKINSYTKSLEDNIGSIDENLEFMMDAFQSLIEISDPSVPDNRDSLEKQREELIEFMSGSGQTIEDIKEFKNQVGEMKGMNRELTRSCDNLISALSTLINTIEESNAKAERMVSLINQELDGDQ